MDFMREAARLALESVRSGEGGPFGAVVVSEGRVVGASGNCVFAQDDPTAHAEMEAIRQACRALGGVSLAGCEIYTTCEPCPMCLGAIHWARIDRIYYALTRHDATAIGFDDALLHKAMQAPRMRMTQVESRDAAEAFRLWAADPDRTGY